MKKYNISKEFGIFGKFKSVYNEIIFTIANPILNIIPVILKHNPNFKITKKKIKSDDNYNINTYIYEPLKFETTKVLLYIHGGGFAYKGNLKQFKLCERYALEGKCKIVYVDYRLAPKYKYPIPLNDCFEVYKWIIKNAETLKIDAKKIIIAGDSAGGCLAVDVILKSIQENLIKPCYQMLIYPVLDKQMTSDSMKKYTNTPMWNSKLNKKMWEYYLGEKEYISPNEISNLTDMPNTYIETAEFDCLHDEGIEFAQKLKKSGVNVILNETKETMHGFDIKNTSITEKAVQERINVIQKI